MNAPVPTAALRPCALIEAVGGSYCGTCGRRDLCLPHGLDREAAGRIDHFVRRRRVPREHYLFRTDDPFHHLFAIHFGHFKLCQVNVAGAEHITGFPMAGELLGIDAIGSMRHRCDAIALDDCEVCEVPYATLERLLTDLPQLLRHFLHILSGEIAREQELILLLSNMRAEQRLAVFLCNLAARYGALGYSSSQFQLRMSRQDLGNHLGLTIESISRLLTRFRKTGLIAVENRGIALLDPVKLRAVAAGPGADD